MPDTMKVMKIFYFLDILMLSLSRRFQLLHLVASNGFSSAVHASNQEITLIGFGAGSFSFYQNNCFLESLKQLQIKPSKRNFGQKYGFQQANNHNMDLIFHKYTII